MPNTNQPCQIELKIPAQREMMLVIRLTTSGVLARCGLTLDAMDDVKMAIEEACNCMIEQGDALESITVQFQRKADLVRIAMTGQGKDGAWAFGMEENELEVVSAILGSMVDNVYVEEADGLISGITFEKKLAN